MNKRIWAGIVACMVFSFSAGWAVSASSLLETISAYLNKEVKLMLHGSPWEPNIDGKTVYPITYEGTTYLPVRAVAEALNVSIRWEQATKTVHIAEPVKADAVYAGSVEAQTVAPGQTDVEREYGSGSVRFVQEADGRLTFVLHGSVREEGDASISLTGSQSADGWSSSEPVEVKIDPSGNIMGGGVTNQGLPSQYRITFDGKMLPETLQLRVELEPMNTGDASYSFDYDLQRITSVPPTDGNSDNTVTEQPDDSGGENTCKRIVWRVQNIANFSGGPMQMIQVPTCVNY
ncbi:stalk domain-containing protein [Paenibacillus senegalensis]|uniref:stalk domain-containing protein n=1 Tax=Paenibacillus senegalensis TaxID=1465766 RepID=UPI0002D84573|nr:stalk domain-containing protein [Paenibacillus senegalensis]